MTTRTREPRNSWRFAAVLLAALLAGSITYTIAQSFETPDIYLDDLPASATYTIKTDGTWYWAVRYDGYVAASSTNCSDLIIDTEAIVEHGEIYIAAGSYYLDTQVSVTSNIWLHGAGMNRTFLYGTMQGDTSVLVIGTVAGYAYNVKLSDMTIDGSGMNFTAHSALVRKGIQGRYIADSEFCNLFIQNTPDSALGIDELQNCVITNVIVKNIGNNGIGIGTGGWDEVEPTIISDCIAINCNASGFTYETSFGFLNKTGLLVLDSCIAINCLDGFTMLDSFNATISNCQAMNCTRGFYTRNWGSENPALTSSKISFNNILATNNTYGIVILSNCSSILVSDSQFYYNTNTGIWIYGYAPFIANGNTTGITISDSFIAFNARGIVGNYPNTTLIEGNQVYDNLMDGIKLDTAVNIQISDNMVYNNGQNVTTGAKQGIYLSGTCSRISVTDNTVFDNQGKQVVGLKTDSTTNSIIEGNQLYGAGTYDLYLSAAGTTANLITGNYFQRTVLQTGNILKNNYGFISENTLTSANTTAATAVFSHGLGASGITSVAASYVWVSFNSSAITGYTWTSNTTHITITPAGTLPASWVCYVKAEYVP